MIIDNVYVYTANKIFVKGGIVLDGDKIARVYEEEDAPQLTGDVLDGKGSYAIPGLIDLHFHGCKGDDVCDGDKEALGRIAEYEASVGVTAISPATMTLPVEELEHVLEVAAEYKKETNDCRKADLVGINMEGPFLDPVKKGAHVEEWITEPDADFVKELNEISGGRIRLVTLAPNVKGAMDFIREMKEEVQISLGHTAADYECAAEAMALGAHHVTHLYNAMQPLAHREPGLIGAASDDPECMVELICDGYHIHPAVIRATFRMFGPERVILISDSMRATGMKNGTYELGGQEVTVKDRKAVLKDGTLAGSATNLFGCMCKAIEFGVPVDQAIFAATRNPARSIGIYDRTGSVHTGKEADILLLTENFELKRVI